MSIAHTIGIDISKSVFQIHGVNATGTPVLTRKVPRAKFAETMASLPPAFVGLEACASSHYWSRRLEAFGHTVRLINPAFVKPYVKSQKNDARDAEAICEAVSRPNMRFVPKKSLEQQDLQAVHRIRSRLIKERTALVNQIRGQLAEYGIVVACGIHRIRRALPSLLDSPELTPRAELLFRELYEELRALDRRIEDKDQEVLRFARADDRCRRLMTMPGIGPMTATALVMSVGNGAEFHNGRHLAAYLGLVPRQHSSGGREHLGRITKRGDRYVRTLLIHGARSVAIRTRRSDGAMRTWVKDLIDRRGLNHANVALANKMARQAWVILAKQTDYRPLEVAGEAPDG
ncbi:MAG: IS110 family transposase [Pseudomonadales bacterium]